MEDANAVSEVGDFLYYAEAVKVNTTIFDHTNAGATNYSTRLNGSVNERTGLARSISVMPGDTVRTEVYAKYLDTNSANWTTALNSFMTAIANSTAPAGTVIDGGAAGSTGGAVAPWSGLLNKGDETGAAPKAYLNYIIFDREFNYLNGGFVRMTTAAREYGQDGSHEKLAAEFVITQPGYVYIYLSNDHAALGGQNVEVYFDDFSVEHVKSPVISTDDYYPGGAPFNSFTRENSLINKKKYQGKEWQTDLGLEKYDFGPREYDPWIWRTPTHDPHAENYYEWSPYSWCFNNPVRYDDPSGKDPGDKVLGFLAAAVDNALGGISPLREMAASYVDDEEDFNSGQDMGDVFSMVSGLMEAESGTGLTAGSLAVTGGTGGLSIEVTGPAAALGVGMTAHGAITTTAGANNFMNQKGRLEARQTNSGYNKTKHTDNRHVDRNKYQEKSKYSKPNQVNKINEKTMKKPDKTTTQKNGRVVYEKDMKRKIGTQGQTTNKVVTDPKKKKIVTSYPTGTN